jgi:hypothetical protein
MTLRINQDRAASHPLRPLVLRPINRGSADQFERMPTNMFMCPNLISYQVLSSGFKFRLKAFMKAPACQKRVAQDRLPYLSVQY